MAKSGGFEMRTGIVKRILMDKKFGFIREEGGTEYFFHQSACRGVGFDELQEGTPVLFMIGSGPKGPRADVVQLDPSKAS